MDEKKVENRVGQEMLPCPMCGGTGCRACHGTGQVPVSIHKEEVRMEPESEGEREMLPCPVCGGTGCRACNGYGKLPASKRK